MHIYILFNICQYKGKEKKFVKGALNHMFTKN
jgi:hypothetical protein